MNPPDIATIQALRSDLALQIARCVTGAQANQTVAALKLGIPQPTLSKIMNGRVSDLSLELLIRISVRAGLPVVLLTGNVPEEAGVFVSGPSKVQAAKRTGTRSRVAEEARDALMESALRLTPEQRLEAFLRHNELVAELHRAGQVAEATRARKSGRATERRGR